jgi:D-alanine-D-alanine ligase-like ATP-grasp enzyme
VTQVLLLATTTGYQIRSFGEAADVLGVRLVFASDRCDRLEDPWWDRAIPVKFHDQSGSVGAVVAAVAGQPIDGVLAVGDRPTILAAHLAAALQLPGNPPEAAAMSRNKLATRRAFQAAGLSTPSFEAVAVASNPSEVARGRPYPVVIKPLALSGSRGVMRVDTEADFVPAFLRLRHLLQSIDIRSERDGAHDQVLIESFVSGREYAVEGVLTAGTLQVFAIFDKPDPLDGPFFEETIYLTPSRAAPATQQAIVQAIVDASRALGLRHGPVHAECRVSERGVFVLEVAPRPIGGLCSRAVRLRSAEGRSASLEEVLLRHAIGQDVHGFVREDDAAGVMMIPIPGRGVLRGLSGVEAACAIPGIDDVHITAKVDETLVPLPEGRSYLGFIFARGGSPAIVERSLRAAHGCLEFAIDRALTIIG